MHVQLPFTRTLTELAARGTSWQWSDGWRSLLIRTGYSVRNEYRIASKYLHCIELSSVGETPPADRNANYKVTFYGLKSLVFTAAFLWTQFCKNKYNTTTLKCFFHLT